MDRNGTKSKKISKFTAEETGASSSAELKRPKGRETKRRHVDVVQPTGFETSQENGGSSIQSQLTLSSQPLSSNIQTQDSEVAPVEGIPSPLVDNMSPMPGDGALDALDGWSLGSNLYFSDTGSGFLESEGSVVNEERGMALGGGWALRSGEGKPKGRLASPVLLRSTLGKKLRPASSQELSEVESPLALDDVSVSESSVRASEDKSRDGDDDELVVDALPVNKPKRNVKGKIAVGKGLKAKKISCPKVTVSQSSASQSSVRMSDDRTQDDGNEEEEEEMVLESVSKPSQNVKAKKTVNKPVNAKDETCLVADALTLCPKVGFKVVEWSQGSSGGDLFAESENLNLKSASQSSLEVEYDRTSPVRELTAVKRGERVRRKKDAKALVFKEKLNEKNKGRSTCKTSKNCDSEERDDDNDDDNDDDDDDEACREVYREKKDAKSAGKKFQTCNGGERIDSKGSQEQCMEEKDVKSTGNTSQNRDWEKRIDNKVSQTLCLENNDVKSTANTSQNCNRVEHDDDDEVCQELFLEMTDVKSVGKASRNVDKPKYNNTEVSQKQYLKKDVQSTSKTMLNVGKSKSNNAKASQEQYLKKNDVQSADKTKKSQNDNKLKQCDEKKQDKYCKKSNIKPGVVKTSKNVDNSKLHDDKKIEKSYNKDNIKSGTSQKSQNVNRFEPDARVGQKNESATKNEGSNAKICASKLKLDSPGYVDEASMDVEQLSKKLSPAAVAIENVENLPKTSSRQSLKRALEKSQETIQDDGKSSAGSPAMDTGNRDDAGSELEDEKKDGGGSNTKNCSAPMKSSAGEKKAKRKRGGMAKRAAPTRAVSLEKPPTSRQNKATVKGVDDGTTGDTDDDKTTDNGRARSPSLFGYESDSMLAPFALAARARKPAGGGLDRWKKGKSPSAGKITGLQRSELSQINTQRKSAHLSKSVLTDSGITAGTPAAFTLASRPGLAKLKTSTPLDQYRSFVGLDKPRKGAKKGKRPRDSGNESDFVLDSNISMLSPVWPARGRGFGQSRAGVTAGEAKRVRGGKVGEVVGNLFLETQAGEVVTGKTGTKKRKATGAKEEFSPSDVCVEEEALKKKDSVENAPTVSQKATSVVNVKMQKKKQDNKGAASKEAKAHQHYVEERYLQELDDIDQNYSLIIDE